MSRPEALDSALEIIQRIGGGSYHVSMNTSGYRLADVLSLEHESVLNDIHLSRHHWDDEENNRIFQMKTPGLAEVQKLSDGRISFSCNLLRGGVENVETLTKYLEAVLDAGGAFAGFVSLLPKTPHCDTVFVEYEQVAHTLRVQDGYLFQRLYRDQDACRCENYLYHSSPDRQIDLYFRRNMGKPCDCIKAWIYTDDNHLVTNFGKDMVLL